MDYASLLLGFLDYVVCFVEPRARKSGVREWETSYIAKEGDDTYNVDI